MLATSEFAGLLLSMVPCPARVARGFFTFDRDGRTCLIDLFNGDLFVQPTVPEPGILEHIEATQCHRCFNHSSSEAAFHCAQHFSQGFIHPVRVCVVVDFEADRRMADLARANLCLSGIHLTTSQLKILSMVFALHHGMVPADVQERIDAVPPGSSLENGFCPFFTEKVEMKRHLLAKNVARHERKRRFLDILLGLEFMEQSHHVMGTRYFDAKIATLRSRLASLPVARD